MQQQYISDCKRNTTIQQQNNDKADEVIHNASNDCQPQRNLTLRQ